MGQLSAQDAARLKELQAKGNKTPAEQQEMQALIAKQSA